MERQCGYITRMVKSRAAANRNLSLGILHMTRLSFLSVAYPSLQFTESSVDRSDRRELQILSAAHDAMGNGDIIDLNPEGHNSEPRIYTTDVYAQQKVVLSHYHWRGSISGKDILDRNELNALNSFIRRSYPSQYQLSGRVHDEHENGISIIRYSNCWINHQWLGSMLTPVRATGAWTSRISSLIMYTHPRHAYGGCEEDDDQTLVGRSGFYAHATIPGITEEVLLAFVERLQVGRHAGHSGLFVIEEKNTVRSVGGGGGRGERIAVDCVDAREIYELIGLVRSRGKRWLCNRITSVI